MDSILGRLRAAGFSAEMTDHAYHALDSHIMGFALWQVGIAEGMARLPGSVAALLEEFPAGRDPADEGEFAFGLDLILDGLDRILGRV